MNEIDDLMQELQSDFQRKLLGAAVRSLQDIENPVRLNNFCTNFRELVRHVLEHLAPNEEIKNCAWYVPDSTSEIGITRGHRVEYLIHGGISVKYACERLLIDVAGERKKFTRAVSELSKYTHVNPSTFDALEAEVNLQVTNAFAALRSLLFVAAHARKSLTEAVHGQVEDEVVNSVLRETVLAVDEIASHHSIEDVTLDHVEVVKIGAEKIELVAYGTLEAELQWGSNSDVRRGDGAKMKQTFPLTLKLNAAVDEPTSIEAIDDSLSVDTTGWYDDYADHDEEAAYLQGQGTGS